MTKNTKEELQETAEKMNVSTAIKHDKVNDSSHQDISESVAVAFGSFIDDINKKKNK
ncbi:MAG: hypothetical protein GQ475_07475 [Methylococcaceae bacterium]|nr:hypothetical protein [Methylococcaceae bacterium]